MNKNMQVQTNIQASRLRDISEVKPLGSGDQTCIEELRAVLNRHGQADRVGIVLLHEHFPIGEDEMLVEHCSPESRTLTIVPVKKSKVAPASVVETAWRVTTDGLEAVSRCSKTHRQGRGFH